MKLLLRALLLMVISSAYAQSNLPTCQGSDTTKWNNCFGTLRFANEGERYVGEIKNGQSNGRGTFFYASGITDKYVGEFKDGLYHGLGVIYYVGGSIGPSGIWIESNRVREQDIQEKKQQAEIEKQLNLYQNTQNQLPTSKPPETNKLQTVIKVESSPAIPFSTSPLAQTPTIPVSPAPLMNPGKRVALVIGNQAYNVRPLLNPRNDADDMSRALKNAGFEVIDVRDASLSQMRNAVRQFGDRLLTRDVGLVYYSGHGIEVRGRNYFIPINSDIKRSDEIADQSLDVSLILEKMETAKKGVNILIVDACRDDPFGRSFRTNSRGLATMDAPQGTIIAFATSPGKVAADGEGRNSPYTKNLIKTMQIPNLPIEQVFKQVRRAVQQETKNQQTPWENTSLSGDFYFSVKK